MILYHGSSVEIPKPDLAHTRLNVDFGPGFYTTPLYEQAAKWCAKFKRRGENGVISRYTLDDTAFQTLRVLQFEAYNAQWLDFILACRSGNDHSDYDIVTGGVANDKVFNTVELYFDGLIDRSEALKRLRYEKPNLQVCLRTTRVLETYLHFEGSEQL